MNREQQTEALLRQAQEDAGGRPSPLLLAMLGLSDRLKRSRTRELLFRGFVLLVVIVGFTLVVGLRGAVDDIKATRAQSRVGLCTALDDMRAKHNHFVQTAINERQALIDAAMDNPNTTQEQKDATVQFFAGQINAYQTDILTIIDCHDTAAVNSLFTTTTVPGG